MALYFYCLRKVITAEKISEIFRGFCAKIYRENYFVEDTGTGDLAVKLQLGL